MRMESRPDRDYTQTWCPSKRIRDHDVSVLKIGNAAQVLDGYTRYGTCGHARTSTAHDMSLRSGGRFRTAS